MAARLGRGRHADCLGPDPAPPRLVHMTARRIYVASSWRALTQPPVVTALRGAGHEVYDFRNPPNGAGFGWEEVMPIARASRDTDAGLVQPEVYLRGLDHPRAIEGFASDFGAMRWADSCVLVLPCNRSAHLELGWAAGAGKRTAILLERGPVIPELMYLLVDRICPDLPALLDWVDS